MHSLAQQNGRECRGTARPIGELERPEATGISAKRNREALGLASRSANHVHETNVPADGLNDSSALTRSRQPADIQQALERMHHETMLVKARLANKARSVRESRTFYEFDVYENAAQTSPGLGAKTNGPSPNTPTFEPRKTLAGSISEIKVIAFDTSHQHQLAVEGLREFFTPSSEDAITQNAPESGKEFEGAIVERVQQGSGLAAQGRPGSAGLPGQPQDQTAQTPTPGAQEIDPIAGGESQTDTLSNARCIGTVDFHLARPRYRAASPQKSREWSRQVGLQLPKRPTPQRGQENIPGPANVVNHRPFNSIRRVSP